MIRILSILFLLWLPATGVFAEYFTIDQFDVRIRIDQKGFFEVTETIDVVFTQPRHGIYRDIPYRYRIDGERYDIDIYDVEVEGRPFKKMRSGNNRRIRIGHPDRYVDGEQRYVIRYKVARAWLFEKEHTEFYWNLLGTDWTVPIDRVTFAIELPGNLNLEADDYRIFTGASGQKGQDATAGYSGGVLSGRSTRTFQPGEGRTVAIRLPKDYISRPSELEKFIADYGLLGFPLTFIGVLFTLWYRHGRDDNFVKMVHFYPPEDLPPAEAGAFIDDKTDNRDLLALIPYWGGQGYLKMREIKVEKLLIFSDTDYEFTKLKNLPADRPQYEKTIFNRIFRDGDVARLSKFKDKFYSTMSTAKSQLRRTVRNRQLHTPRSRMIFGLLPLATLLCFILGGVFGFYFEHLAAGISMAVVGFGVLIIRRPMLKKNKQGMDLYRQLYGFRMFVDQADRNRLERLLQYDPAYFEKTLPYAISFNMAKKWTKNFNDLFTEPPSWYVSSHPYHGPAHGNSFESFASHFNSSIKEVQSVFTSQPGSSGSGGGFSGGSSGGGFGGGGGGSW
jgi:uncharacterized membrane protein YgcG